MKNKILAILPSKVLYGKERSNIEVYNLLQKEGQEVIVLANNSRNENLDQALDGLRVQSFKYPNRHRKSFRLVGYILDFVMANWKLRRIIKSENPDILFFCTETSFYDLYFAIRKFKGKIIYRIGDAPAFRKLSFFKYNSWVWNHFVVNKIDTFVSISGFIKQTVKEEGRDSAKDQIIYNYPPTRKEMSFIDEPLKHIVNLQNKQVLKFGYIGQIIADKGVKELIISTINLLDKGKNINLYIAGDLNYDSKFGAVLKESIPINYLNNIIFLGEVKNIKEFFKNIDVLCVPSIKQEPLGNVLVEAKSYSTPCIIFPSGGMPELISHKIDGFICKSQTSEALIDGLEYYINHPESIVIQSNLSFESIDKLEINRDSFEKKWLNVFNINK